MSMAVYALSREAFLTSTRSLTFRVMVFLAAFGGIGAALISEWTVEDPRRLYFNITAFLLEVAGGWLAVTIGLRLSVDDRECGSRLAAMSLPIRHSQWFISRSIGIVAALLLFSALALAWVQGSMILFGLGPLENPQRVMLLFILVFWLVMGHISFLFGELFPKFLAVLLLLALWLIGQISGASPGLDGAHSLVLAQRYFHYLWQPDNLLLVGTITSPMSTGLPPAAELLARAGHGVFLCITSILLAAVLARRNRLPGVI